jgi:hypothetical protein
MKKYAVTLALLAGLMVSPALAGDNDVLVGESRALVKQFFGELKGNLVRALKSGGPVEAIATCSIDATLVAQSHSERSGWNIARTSLKLRNPKNAPDSWERGVLEKFDLRLAQGENPKKMEYSEIVSMNGKQVFRYMKAIPTAKKPCLACHGSKLKQDVIETLETLYPHDKATGYKAGQIRGAFTLRRTL